MEGGNDLGDAVRKQVEEIMKDYEKKSVGDIPLNVLFPFLLNTVFRYEVREDIQQEDIDEIIRKLMEIGFPDTLAQEVSNKIYKIIPTREMKMKIARAEELAETYLPNLADEVKNGESYLNTQHGRKIKLTTGPPEIKEDNVEVPIYLFNQWHYPKGDKVGVSTSQTSSGLHILVEQPLGNYKISGPTREEFRQSTLEAALDYLASPHPSLLRNIDK